MGRTYVEIPYQCSKSEAKRKIEDYLTAKKFEKVTNKKGEKVWQLGKGYVSVISFIKADYEPDRIMLYGWIAGVGLGRRSAIESNLKGFYATVPKRKLKKMMTEIKDLFINMIPAS